MSHLLPLLLTFQNLPSKLLYKIFVVFFGKDFRDENFLQVIHVLLSKYRLWRNGTEEIFLFLICQIASPYVTYTRLSGSTLPLSGCTNLNGRESFETDPSRFPCCVLLALSWNK